MKKYLNKEFLLTNKGKIVKGAAVIILVIVSFFVFILGGGGQDEELKIETAETAEMQASEASEPVRDDLIMVYVCGAVNEPKVVELPADSRVADAISQAGGLSENADTAQINQAAFLTDGEKVYVPETGENVTDAAIGVSAYPGKVDINTASSEELQTLDGVGPATAEKILKYRSSNGSFKSIEDIKNVDGIGDKTFDSLKEYIKV